MPCTFCGSREHSLSRCPWRQARDAWLGLPPPVRVMGIIAIVLLILAAIPLPAGASEREASNGGDSVTITEQPCSNTAVLQLIPRAAEYMNNARAVVGGREFGACWIREGDAAHLVYEDGDQGLVPLADFGKPKPEA